MRVKVCGMTHMDQILQLNEWDVSFVGMIFYDQSPRYIKKFDLQPVDLRREKLKIRKVGVFVNESLERILEIIDEWALDMVQLHGDETPKFCEQVREHVRTIKAFRLMEQEDIIWKIHPYQDSVDHFLFDNGGKGTYGGTGEKFNWTALEKIKTGKSFMLSGGIGPDDVSYINDFASIQQEMFAIDLNSKFEQTPGVKDMNLIRSFLNALNN